MAKKNITMEEVTDSISSRAGTYHEETEVKYMRLLEKIAKTLPPCARHFLNAEGRSSAKSKLSYAYDLRTFFRYLQKNVPSFQDMDMTEWTPEMLEKVDILDIEAFSAYMIHHGTKLTNGTKPEEELSPDKVGNEESARKRKMSVIRSFYTYCQKKRLMKENPAAFADLPKVKEKKIVYMDEGETAELLDRMEHGTVGLKGRALKFSEKTRLRDLAIVTLLLGTGIRVSECVGINLNNISFRDNSISVTRKGGKEETVYFGEEVETALLNYMEEREKIQAKPGHENALFLSIQKRRISVQAVENLVVKYTSRVIEGKKITPHKLRSTYGTSLYRNTGDIYLVATALGHNDVNTTRVHYAHMDENRRRMAAESVRLRETEPKKKGRKKKDAE